jgi:hypothetical protein
MKRRTWIVLGSLTGLLTGPVIVLLAAVLVRDLRGPVFQAQGVPALVISGAAGVVLGAFVTARIVPATPRRAALLGAISGFLFGAFALGSLFLAIEVTGSDWPQGLSAFLTGAIPGGALGGVFGGMAGFSRAQAPPGGGARSPQTRSARASRLDVR